MFKYVIVLFALVFAVAMAAPQLLYTAPTALSYSSGIVRPTYYSGGYYPYSSYPYAGLYNNGLYNNGLYYNRFY